MSALWLTADEIIELVNAVIRKDGTAACPYSGRAHLYTGPRYEIHEDRFSFGRWFLGVFL